MKWSINIRILYNGCRSLNLKNLKKNYKFLEFCYFLKNINLKKIGNKFNEILQSDYLEIYYVKTI
jgi:hypothetical protein